MPLYSDFYSPTYLDTYGVLFPNAPLDINLDLLLDNVWTDTSPYIYQRDGGSPPIAITRGKPNESSSSVTPADALWEWKNTDGRFSPRNPMGPYYKLLMRNTAVRISIGALANYLRLESSNSSRAFVPSNGTISITGSAEIRMAFRLTDWQGCVLAERYDNSQPSWYLLLNNDATLTFSWFDSGATQHTATSSLPLPYTSGDTALKVTLDSTTGNVAFYTAPTISGSYTQLGVTQTPTSGAATSIRAGNASLVVGWSNTLTNPQMYGRVYEFQLRNGIGGSLVADGIFSAQAAGATTWSDSSGNVWTVTGGAEISGRDYRFHGQMSSQPPTWDKTARDMAVAAEAGGPLRIIGQAGTKNVSSPVYRAISTQTGTFTPVAYWPMEDGSGATNFGSAVGGSPLTWVGSNPNLSVDTSFIGSAALPTINNAAMFGPVQSYAGLAPWNSTGTKWSVSFLTNFKTLPASGSTTYMQVNISNGYAGYLAFGIDSGGNVIMNVYDAFGTLLVGSGSVSWTGGIQQPLFWQIKAIPSGANVNYVISSVQPGATVGLTFGFNSASAGVAGYVNSVLPDPFSNWPDTVLGHLQVQADAPSLFALGAPLNAWTGEAAAVRFARVCGENGWPARILGASSISAAMGAQPIASFQSILEDCQKADMGQMFETRQVLGLGYRTLASILNQSPTLSIPYSTTISGTGESNASGLAPTYDDYLTKNDYTITRGNGSITGATYRFYLNDGSALSITVVGDYPQTDTLNLSSDLQLPNATGWLVHMGTVDEARWANIPFNLARAALSSYIAALMSMDIGDSINISSIPTNITFDPIGQVALGFSEEIGAFYWWIRTNNAPASPYNTGIYDDLVYGRADTDGSTLTSNITSGATSFQVTTTTTGTPVWTTAAGDFPFDINIGGERMTVINITGATSPQTFTISARAVNGVVKAHTAGDDVRLWFPPIYAPI